MVKKNIKLQKSTVKYDGTNKKLIKVKSNSSINNKNVLKFSSITPKPSTITTDNKNKLGKLNTTKDKNEKNNVIKSTKMVSDDSKDMIDYMALTSNKTIPDKLVGNAIKNKNSKNKIELLSSKTKSNISGVKGEKNIESMKDIKTINKSKKNENKNEIKILTNLKNDKKSSESIDTKNTLKRKYEDDSNVNTEKVYKRRLNEPGI